jgi:molybdopterin converting factor small subunit
LSITVIIHQALHHLTNEQATVSVSGTTVGECLDELVQQFPGIRLKLFGKNRKLLNYIDIYVNQDSSLSRGACQAGEGRRQAFNHADDCRGVILCGTTG